MSDDPLALPTIPPAPSAQAAYDVICDTLMRSERGRWFLQEYAKRNRNADTDVLLIAIHRLEMMVRADKEEHGRQSLRSDLLEMAKAITRTRAEVAGIKPAGAPSFETGSAPVDSVTASPTPEPPPAPNDVLAAALRIRDVTWAMRGHGFDPAVCQQLEELAATILSASSLGDPADRRTSKLTEVLTYLERRINSLLDESTQAKSGDTEPAALVHANGHDATDYKQLIDRMNGSEATANVPEPAVAADAKAPQAPAPDATATRAPVPASGSSARPNEPARAALADLDLPPSRIVLRPGSPRAVTHETTDSALLLGIDTLTTLWTFDTAARIPATPPLMEVPAGTRPAVAEPTQTVPVEEAIGKKPEPSADAREPIESALAPAETAPATAAAVDDVATKTTAGAKTDAVESTSIDALSEASAATSIETPNEPPVAAATATPVAPHAVQASAAALDPDDPLALLMAMSEAERIALFS